MGEFYGLNASRISRVSASSRLVSSSNGASSPRLSTATHPFFPTQGHRHINSLSSIRSNNGPLPVPRTQRRSTSRACGTTSLGILHNVPSKKSAHAPPFERLPLFFFAGYTAFISASVRPTAPCEHHPNGNTSHSIHCSTRSACTGLAGIHLAISVEARVGREPFPRPMPAIMQMVRFGRLKPPGHGYLHKADSDLMQNTVPQCFSGTCVQHVFSMMCVMCGM